MWPNWVWYAIVSMFFAGVTGVIAKLGLQGISAQYGLMVRTCFVFVFTMLVGVATVSRAELPLLTSRNLFWLGVSGATTAASWIFYYHAIKAGEVSTVALIDKGSFLVAVCLAWLILQEPITLRVLLGSGLILAGLLVVAWK